MSLFDKFINRNPDPTTAAPSTVATGLPGNIPNPTEIGAEIPVPGQGTIPNAADPAKVESPLESFKQLWEPVPTDPNAPPDAPAKALDQAAVRKIVDNSNFADQLDPAMMAAVAAGGEGATVAFTQALEQVARNVMVQSTMVSDKITEQKVKEALEKHTASLPGMLRKQAITDHSATTNPLFKDPAIAPVIDATQAALALQHPNATPAEITKMTQDYVIAMGAAFTPKPVISDPEGETDWEAYVQQ
jgi:hypothetical protein